ncbi:MAG: hypothetical protein Q7S06_02780 [Nanoarchaeota archaeon]|nr:hypothetical protein [Nanoarchaeota archaeon]
MALSLLKTGFVGWANFKSLKFPNRIYLHKAGLELYTNACTQHPYYQALNAAREQAIKHYYSSMQENLPEWIIAAVWTAKVDGVRKTILDVFENRDAVENWPGNPDVSTFNINGTDSTRASSCGDTLMMLGLEEEFRRECPKPEDYFKPIGNTFFHEIPNLLF